MATLRITIQEEMPFQEALDRAKTGDIITISPAPKDIGIGDRFPHMTGVLSLIQSNVYLNDMWICSNDVKETHALAFFPFYESILLYRKNSSHGSMMHEFYWIRPSDPKSASKNTSITPKPAFHLKADELKIVPLSSGKGLILIEKKPKQQFLLLKKKRFLGKTFESISAKNVTTEWEGDHALYADTPSGVVVGVKMTSSSGMSIIRYFRGHRNRIAVHDHPSKDSPSIWATDNDFFYESLIHGEKCIISATTNRMVYHEENDEQNRRYDKWYEPFATSEALVRCRGTRVEANGRLVTDSFNYEWIVPHAHGVLYGWGGEIRMLVIKENLQLSK